MNFQNIIRIEEHPQRADNGVSNNKTDFEIDPSLVTLSDAKGLSHWASRCFAAAQHDSPATSTDDSINVFMCIIGGVRDKSAPTGGRINF